MPTPGLHRPAVCGPALADPTLVPIDTWIFDLDNTLYPARCGLFAHMQRRIVAYLARSLALDEAAARSRQKEFVQRHGTTLRGLMCEHGHDPDPFLAYVHDIDLSSLTPDPALIAVIDRLPGRKLIYTNACAAHAERTLRRLGLEDRFEAVFDIRAADYLPKPHPSPYQRLIDRYSINPARAVMVEDTVANLTPAHALGMATVWVRSQEASDTDSTPPPAHVGYIIDDLAAWLCALAP
jgi:putative hydrolase of the HAD superfamily